MTKKTNFNPVAVNQDRGADPLCESELRYRRLEAAQDGNADLWPLVAKLRTREEVPLEPATRDPITGLFNRRYLDDTLARELSLAWRRGASLSLVILDIDQFKKINDRLGHDAGDVALCGCAHVLSQNLRKSDIACRLGAEEFAIVLPDSSMHNTLRRVTELCALVSQTVLCHSGHFLGRMTLSAGIASAPEHAFTAPNLLRAADDALYVAKHAGRDQVVLSSSRNGLAPEGDALVREDQT